jgi:hypothetical protein
MTPHFCVAILVNDEVIAMSDDQGAVRVAAGMIASAPIPASEPIVLQPITNGRKQSCHMIAMGAA